VPGAGARRVMLGRVAEVVIGLVVIKMIISAILSIANHICQICDFNAADRLRSCRAGKGWLGLPDGGVTRGVGSFCAQFSIGGWLTRARQHAQSGS